jgi:hypothetical protein
MMQAVHERNTEMSTISDLQSGGKRVRTHDAQMVFKLPQAAKDLVSRVAAKEVISEGAVLRQALAEYFERRGYRS